MYEHQDNITKFINYLLRELYASKRSEEEKRIAYSLYTYLDTLVDKLRHVSERIEEHGCTPKVKGYLKEIFDVFFDEFHLLRKRQTSVDFIKKRYDVKNRLSKEKFTVNELWVLAEAFFFLEVLNQFFEYILVKNIMEQK
jgi:hypothetical protein